MPSNDRQLNADQLLLLADAFEKLAKQLADEAAQNSLRTPFDIAKDMIKKATDAKDIEAYKQAIKLFDDIKRAHEEALNAR